MEPAEGMTVELDPHSGVLLGVHVEEAHAVEGPFESHGPAEEPLHHSSWRTKVKQNGY